MHGRVLIIAGSDSSGGAGIQADIKTVTALNGYAMTAITALTAQNTLGVFGIHAVPVAFLREQIDVCLNDIGADSIKTGMLHNDDVVTAVVESIARNKNPVSVVVDPVMFSKSKERLIEKQAIGRLQTDLFPRTSVLTPNIPEAEILTGIAIENTGDMKKAAELLLRQGPKSVLIKGGHMPPQRGDTNAPQITDLLATESEMFLLPQPYLKTAHTHGTGCTMASAIATGLAQKMPLLDAVKRAQQYVFHAIRTAPGLGGGHGPLNHSWVLDNGS